MSLPNASGAICVCGHCAIAMELHPVPQCPYEYAVVKQDGRPIGYFMLGKKTEKKKDEKKNDGIREENVEPGNGEVAQT